MKAFSYIFIFVSCCHQASTSSVKPSDALGQHKWNHKNNINPLVRDPLEIKDSLRLFNTKCIECTGYTDCEHKLNDFCKQPGENCDFSFPIMTRDCSSESYCNYDTDCEWMWANSICDYTSNRCICDFFYRPHFAKLTCDFINYPTLAPTKRTTPKVITYKQECYSSRECNAANSWSGLWCQSGRCICPPDSRPDHSFKRCIHTYIDPTSSSQNDYVIGISIACITILICVSVCVCVSRRRAAIPIRRNHDSPPIGVSNTISHLEMLREIAQPPPEYSDIYTIRPHDQNNVPHYKLPSYEEAVQQPVPEFTSQPLYVVGAQSSEENRNPMLATGTSDGRLQSNDNRVETSQSDGHTNHGYITDVTLAV